MEAFAKSVKVFLPNKEIRRFELEEKSYEHFCVKVKNLCSLDLEKNDHVVSYLDVEGDQVGLASELEWKECIKYHSKGCLKITIKTKNTETSFEEKKEEEVGATDHSHHGNEDQDNPWNHPFAMKGMFGRGRGRGMCGRGRGWRMRGMRGMGMHGRMHGKMHGRGRRMMKMMMNLGRMEPERDVSPNTRRIRLRRKVERLQKQIFKKEKNFHGNEEKKKQQIEAIKEKITFFKKKIELLEKEIAKGNSKNGEKKMEKLERKLGKCKEKEEKFTRKLDIKNQKNMKAKKAHNNFMQKQLDKQEKIGQKLRNLELPFYSEPSAPDFQPYVYHDDDELALTTPVPFHQFNDNEDDVPKLKKDLSTLEELGFKNKKLNRILLMKFKDVNVVIDKLISMEK